MVGCGFRVILLLPLAFGIAPWVSYCACYFLSPMLAGSLFCEGLNPAPPPFSPLFPQKIPPGSAIGIFTRGPPNGRSFAPFLAAPLTCLPCLALVTLLLLGSTESFMPRPLSLNALAHHCCIIPLALGGANALFLPWSPPPKLR